MNFAPADIATANVDIAIADDPSELIAFKKADCPAAILQRHPNPNFQEWINQIDANRLPRGRNLNGSKMISRNWQQSSRT